MKNRKITLTALSFIIIQTILTLGLNWVYFLIYFSIENTMINSVLHKDIKKKTFTLISIISLCLVLSIFAFIILINNENKYFLFDSLKTSLLVLVNHKFLFFVIFIILSFVLSVYIYFIKELYESLFKIKRTKPKDSLEWLITALTWIYKIFVIGFYELYVYLINKNINHKKSKISLLGKFSLLLIYTLLFINLIYMLINISFINPIFIYFIILSFINPILNYGLYELKIRLILNEELYRYEREDTDKIFRFNKILYSLFVIIMVGFILNITVFIRDNEEIDFNINTQNLNCQNDNNINVCMKDYSSQLPRNYIIDYNFSNFDNHFLDYADQMNNIAFNYHNLNKIDPKGIKYTNKYKNEADNLVYKSEGILNVRYFYTIINYVYVETYYHKDDNNTYIPLFNIIKTIEMIPTFDSSNVDSTYKTLKMDETIYYNHVFIYDFLNNTLNLYDRDYTNIDTSRLIIDNINVQLTASTNNFIGYDTNAIYSGSALVSNTLNNYFDNNLKQYALSFIDPFMVTSSLLFNSSYYNKGESTQDNSLEHLLKIQSHNFDVNSIQYPYDLQYIVFNYYNNIDVYNNKDDDKLYVYNHHEDRDVSYNFYYNKNEETNSCPWNNKYDIIDKFRDIEVLNYDRSHNNYVTQCIENHQAELTKTIDLTSLPIQYRMAYKGDGVLKYSDNYYDFYGKDFSSVEPVVTYEVKTVQQHFSSEELINETLKFNTLGERVIPEEND